MRMAELVMAVAMAVFSLYLMWKSAELPIGWIPEEGPGGGAFSFWLSLGMFVCCIAILIRWFRRDSAPSQSSEPYMDAHSKRLFFMAVGSLAAMLASIHFIGVYGAIPLFLMFYMRIMGRHPWKLTGILALSMPVVTFFFFEIALKITLPKGETEPLFYPLYDMFL
jgi:hypothetical protein